MEILIKIYNWFKNLSNSDLILFMTFLAIVWYTLETRMLKQWQKKQVQATLFSIEMDRFRNHGELGGLSFRIPMALRKIYELGKFDLREFYVDKEPLRMRDHLIAKLKKWTKK